MTQVLRPRSESEPAAGPVRSRPAAAAVRSRPAQPAVPAAPGRRGNRAPAVVLAFDVAALVALLPLVGFPPLAGPYVGAAVLVLGLSGGYRNRLTLRALEAAPWIAGRLAIALLLATPVAVMTGSVDELPILGVLALAVVIPARGASYWVVRSLRRRGRLLEPTVILGAGQVGGELARLLRAYPEYGLQPVAFVTSATGSLPLPVRGDVDQLDAVLEQTRARHMIVAFDLARSADLVSILRTALQHDVTVYIVPRFFDCAVVPEGPDTDDVRGIPLYRVRRSALRRSSWTVKRLVDVTVAGGALLVLSPVMLVIALAVRVSSPGPILFRQRRVGKAGREIDVVKFRSMLVNADSDTQWSVAHDDRTTALGRLLRRTSLDELPQLWSVLKGDMSLVGPRPERPYFVDLFSADIRGYGDRHRVPVGITGWAQVNGLRGDDASIAERSRYDNNYIEHWSPWRDCVILFRTFGEVLRGVRGQDR